MNTLAVLLVVLCIYALAYRYYSAFLAARVAALDRRWAGGALTMNALGQVWTVTMLLSQ